MDSPAAKSISMHNLHMRDLPVLAIPTRIFVNRDPAANCCGVIADFKDHIQIVSVLDFLSNDLPLLVLLIWIKRIDNQQIIWT